jgi:hypothetical protein
LKQPLKLHNRPYNFMAPASSLACTRGVSEPRRFWRAIKHVYLAAFFIEGDTMRITAGGIIASLIIGLPATSLASTLVVAPASYPTIQSAINAAHAGDTVRIMPLANGAARNESITVSTSKLVLEGRNGATLDGTGLSANGITIGADRVTVKGLTIRNFSEFGCSGIEVDGDRAEINSNIISQNRFGVFVNSTNAHIAGSTISRNLASGVFLAGSGALVEQNTVCQNQNAAINVISGGNSISNNEVANNLADGIYVSTGSSVFGDPPPAVTKIESNNVHDNPANGIGLDFSDSVIVRYNTVNHNATGIRLLNFSFNCTVTTNIITCSIGTGLDYYRSGIILEDFTLVSGCSVTYNAILGNAWDGIEVGAFNTDNIVTDNISIGNCHFDAEDSTYDGFQVYNTWKRDIFVTSNPAGLGR